MLSKCHETCSESKCYPLGSKLSMHQIPSSALQEDACEEYPAIRSSSFTGEHSITKALERRARSTSSRSITVYNSKSDGYYQSFKESPETAFL